MLLLPSEFSETQLYETISSLSYSGDPRMKVGENPDKVSNLVRPSLPYFRDLYRPFLSKLQDDKILKWDEKLNKYEKYDNNNQKDNEIKEYLVKNLPIPLKNNLNISNTFSSPLFPKILKEKLAKVVGS